MSSVSRSVGRPVTRSVLVGQVSTLASLIKSIFANNEQGFAYDPNDLTTLYQDAAGTIPVTAAGQPVGLMLDKSKGLVLGVEKSSYASGFSSLTGINAVGVSTSLIDGALVATSISTDGNDRAEIPISGLVVGRIYTVDVVVKGNQINNQAVYSWTVGSVPVMDIKSTDYTKYKFSFIATAESGVARVYAGAGVGAAGGVIQVKSLSIKELTGNHAYQTVSASRPILQLDATTGAYYLEFDGVDDRLVTSSFPSMGLAISVFIGSQGSKATTAAIVARGVGGYISQTSGQVAVQSVNNPVTVSASGKTVVTVKYAASGTGVSLKVNNLSSTNPITTERGFNISNPLVIGAFDTNGTVSYLGRIYSLIGIGRLTTDSETIALEKAIAKNVGVTLNV